MIISSLLIVLQAQQYAALRKPYLINDMLMQDILLDRRKVYQQLQVCFEIGTSTTMPTISAALFLFLTSQTVCCDYGF